MIRECYKLIQEIAVALDPFCIHPGCNNPSVVGHHLFKRDRMATAFHVECVKGLCDQHHKVAHADPNGFTGYMIGKIGPRYDELLRLSHTVVKNIDFKKERDKLKFILQSIRKNGSDDQ